jgi:AcrR family transcriptional regulator
MHGRGRRRRIRGGCRRWEGTPGARVDRIAAAAGVNKERIYQYFGKKDLLFDAVIASQLSKVVDEVRIEGSGPEALADDAGRLERGDYVVNRPDRAANCSNKADGVIRAMPGTSREDAADLLLTVIALCDAWPVLPELDGLMAGKGSSRAERRRKAIVQTVLLAAQALVQDRSAV